MNLETTINNILSQAPDNTTEELIKELFIKYDGDETEILLKLWNIPEPTIKNVDYNEKMTAHKNKWKNIREICDAHDEEMSRYMNDIKTRQIAKNKTLNNIPEQSNEDSENIENI